MEVDGRRAPRVELPVGGPSGQRLVQPFHLRSRRSAEGSGDGFVYRVRPDGRAEIMAEGFHFTNGLAMDPDERHLYVCQTVGCDVVRLPIRPDGTLGSKERYGPSLGGPAIETPPSSSAPPSEPPTAAASTRKAISG